MCGKVCGVKTRIGITLIASYVWTRSLPDRCFKNWMNCVTERRRMWKGLALRPFAWRLTSLLSMYVLVFNYAANWLEEQTDSIRESWPTQIPTNERLRADSRRCWLTQLPVAVTSQNRTEQNRTRCKGSVKALSFHFSWGSLSEPDNQQTNIQVFGDVTPCRLVPFDTAYGVSNTAVWAWRLSADLILYTADWYMTRHVWLLDWKQILCVWVDVAVCGSSNLSETVVVVGAPYSCVHWEKRQTWSENRDRYW